MIFSENVSYIKKSVSLQRKVLLRLWKKKRSDRH